MDAIAKRMPLEGVTDTTGSDGFLALTFGPDADVKRPYREILRRHLYEFAIMITFRPENSRGGYLFSVVNPYDTVVQLGVELSPVVKDRWNVTLLYTDSGLWQESKRLASFEMDYSKDWTQISLEVYSESVGFYLNCERVETQTVKRVPLEFHFDSASTVYVAQAGPILKGKFQVSTCN